MTAQPAQQSSISVGDIRVTYLPDGDNVALDLPHAAGSVAATFDSTGVEALVRWAQANEPDYSYVAFCEKVKSPGCAGYLVCCSAAAWSITDAPPKRTSRFFQAKIA